MHNLNFEKGEQLNINLTGKQFHVRTVQALKELQK